MPIDLSIVECIVNPRKRYNWETGKSEDADPWVIDFYDFVDGKISLEDTKNLSHKRLYPNLPYKHKILSKRHKT